MERATKEGGKQRVAKEGEEEKEGEMEVRKKVPWRREGNIYSAKKEKEKKRNRDGGEVQRRCKEGKRKKKRKAEGKNIEV